MQAKGHPIFWSIPKCVPDWALRYDTKTLMKFVEVRVRNLVARFRGKVTLWDAVNEPMWEAAPKNLHTRNWPHMEDIREIASYVSQVLGWCRDEDPCATFLVNDYGMEVDKAEGALRGNDGSKVTAKSQRKRYLEMLARLSDKGAAPDAVGLQSHIGWLEHDTQWAIYDEFSSATGLPVHITEFWANMGEMRDSGKYSDEELAEIEAEYIANYMTCAFGHPAVEGFFFWGLMGRSVTWRNEYSGHILGPVYRRVYDLLHREWHTHEEGVTDSDGVFRFRGFLGDYDLVLRKSSRQQPRGQRFRLDSGATMPLVVTAR
jgi:GH35 family endo-1,4-beta-xylanase